MIPKNREPLLAPYFMQYHSIRLIYTIYRLLMGIPFILQPLDQAASGKNMIFR